MLRFVNPKLLILNGIAHSHLYFMYTSIDQKYFLYACANHIFADDLITIYILIMKETYDSIMTNNVITTPNYCETTKRIYHRNPNLQKRVEAYVHQFIIYVEHRKKVYYERWMATLRANTDNRINLSKQSNGKFR